jgi:hypothetical protein
LACSGFIEDKFDVVCGWWIQNKNLGGQMTPKSISLCASIASPDFDGGMSKDLIDEGARWWNVQLVKEIFNEEEAEKICSLPLSSHGHTNKLI